MGDFDADKCHLSYSRGAEKSEMIRWPATSDRLRAQFLPVQMRLLQEYGKSTDIAFFFHSFLFGSNARDALEKPDLVWCPLQTTNNAQAIASHFAAISQAAPKCACGSFLER